MLIDLHVHTDISPCSVLSLEEILHYAPLRGLDGVCLTDHDTMEIEEQLKSVVPVNGLKIFVGMEYTTAQGDYLIFGDFRDLKPGLAARELAHVVRERSGAIIGAHPFRAVRGADLESIVHSPIGVVEGINGRNTNRENLMAQEFARENGLAMCAGSDAHTVEELGGFPTVFDRPVNSVGELIQAVNSKCFSAYDLTPCAQFSSNEPGLESTAKASFSL